MAAFQIDDLPIESAMLTNALDEAQRKVESYFYDIRNSSSSTIRFSTHSAIVCTMTAVLRWRLPT